MSKLKMWIKLKNRTSPTAVCDLFLMRNFQKGFLGTWVVACLLLINILLNPKFVHFIYEAGSFDQPWFTFRLIYCKHSALPDRKYKYNQRDLSKNQKSDELWCQTLGQIMASVSACRKQQQVSLHEPQLVNYCRPILLALWKKSFAK